MKYGPHERQRLWASQPEPEATRGSRTGGRWLVVVHGGLWRDERITEATGIKLATDLARHFSGVASIDYRLSPEIKHPVHLEDCHAALKLILDLYKPASLVLAGHSAGCYLAGQLAMLPLAVPVRVIGIEGIYDVADLVAEYPVLAQPIGEAFDSVYDRPDWAALDLVIVHSLDDELVSMRQPRLAASLNARAPFLEVRGGHDEVFEQVDLAPVLGPACE